MELKRRSLFGLFAGLAVAPRALAELALPASPPVLPSDPAICLEPFRGSAGLTVTVLRRNQNGELQAYLKVAWTPAKNYVHEVIIDGDYHGLTTTNQYFFGPVKERRTYNVKLRAVDQYGITTSYLEEMMVTV